MYNVLSTGWDKMLEVGVKEMEGLPTEFWCGGW